MISDGTPITRRGRATARAHRLADEVHQHLLGGVEVGDDAVRMRPHRPDVRRRPPEHLVRLDADRLDLPLAVLKATIEGSLRTMPRPWAKTQVLAVPRSMAMSVAKLEKNDIEL